VEGAWRLAATHTVPVAGAATATATAEAATEATAVVAAAVAVLHQRGVRDASAGTSMNIQVGMSCLMQPTTSH
jgi:hypothetical protein